MRRGFARSIRVAALAACLGASDIARALDPGRIVFVVQDQVVDNLFVVNADGTGLAQLTHLPQRTLMANPPAWSRDGRYIAFDGSDGAYILGVGAPGNPVLACRAYSFVWSRDSRALVCLSGGRGDPRLFTVEVNGLRTTEVPVGWPPFTDASVFGLTSDAGVNKLAFVKGNFRYGRATSREIYTVNADGTALVNIAPRPAGSYNSVDGLVFSPDGQRLAFCHYEIARSIATIRPDGSELRILGGGPAVKTQTPSWSPDASAIAWYDDDGIVVTDANGKTKSRPAGGRGGTDPAFSPDGKRIAFACAAYSGRICVMNTDGSGLKILTQLGRRYVGRPVWRP